MGGELIGDVGLKGMDPYWSEEGDVVRRPPAGIGVDVIMGVVIFRLARLKDGMP